MLKPLGDYADFVIDIFRNTKTADVVMYIASVVSALFQEKG